MFKYISEPADNDHRTPARGLNRTFFKTRRLKIGAWYKIFCRFCRVWLILNEKKIKFHNYNSLKITSGMVIANFGTDLCCPAGQIRFKHTIKPITHAKYTQK
jgi:hypothetical protein